MQGMTVDVQRINDISGDFSVSGIMPIRGIDSRGDWGYLRSLRIQRIELDSVSLCSARGRRFSYFRKAKVNKVRSRELRAVKTPTVRKPPLHEDREITNSPFFISTARTCVSILLIASQ